MSRANPKEIVRRFNAEVIEEGNARSFAELMAADFVNHAAPPGSPNGPESMWNTFENILRPAISELRVRIDDQIAEGDMVTTRKSVTGILTGRLLGPVRRTRRSPSTSSTSCAFATAATPNTGA